MNYVQHMNLNKVCGRKQASKQVSWNTRTSCECVRPIVYILNNVYENENPRRVRKLCVRVCVRVCDSKIDYEQMNGTNRV